MNADEYITQLQDRLNELQDSVENTLRSGFKSSAEIDGLYALLHNTKNTAAAEGYGLVTQVCSLACGILQRSPNVDESVLKAVKAHIDALVIIAAHDLDGDGGALGQEMVCELEGLAKAVNA